MTTPTKKTKTTTISEPHKVSAHPFTVQNATDDIVSILANAQRMLDRSSYLELLVRVADNVNDRADAVHEEIAKEHHEDRDE